ncbi:hypothetical protein SUGI_1129010 [Cryptomeria japonica]|nr:hypothetical protein SUGI_1129010 [Cryptomeria japonica]
MAAELPQGFVERTQSRGLLVTEWAPQLHILSYSSVGAFLTHCGRNSVTEGLRFGGPLVTLPLQHEQSLNAKLIAEELKLGWRSGEMRKTSLELYAHYWWKRKPDTSDLTLKKLLKS